MKTRSPSKVTPCYFNQDKLKIIIRIRPILNEEDSAEFVELQDDNTLQIKRPGNHSYMKFNNILPALSGQKDVFSLVEDSIKQFLNGINITIFAYGQTGAGKTYSMIGNYSPKDSQQNLFNFLSSKERGILSRSLEMIMATVNQKKSSHRVFVSFFQIYNQKIFDLYNNTGLPLDIRQSKSGQISIPQLVNIEVNDMEEAIQYLMVGLKNRATGSTHGNAQSSRSHSIFQINLEREDESGEIVYSSLRIVDLAGSQKFKIPSDLSPSEKQVRIQELTNINGSLSCLGHCISALIQKSRTHIPFRNSKLTRILSDSLLGQGKMRFIICISPSCTASAETFSTLQFANRAKKAIFERAQMRTPNLSKKKTSTESEQISLLKKELQKEREQRSLIEREVINIHSQREEELMKQNTYLKKQNQKLKKQLKEILIKKDTSRSRSPQTTSRISDDCARFCQDNKENNSNFREEMLRLPIFQNNPSKLIHEQKQIKKINKGEGPIHRSSISMNKKKAEFQKKIKRFIEADSPPDIHPRPTANISSYSHMHFGHYINRQNRQGNKKQNQIYRESPSSPGACADEDQWVDNEDTQQFIQKACQKMNLPDFKDLRTEVQRAKQELQLLKQKDDQISRMKICL